MSTLNLSHTQGEYVVYKKKGVYQITDIRKEKMCGVLNTYYVLKSVYDGNASVYVPVDHEDLTSQMEHVLSREEIADIIEKSKTEDVQWIAQSAERSEYLEEIIASENLSRIIAMHSLLTEKKEEALKNKSKTFAHDERMLSCAQKIVSEAFAFSLGIDKKQVMDYIAEKL